jgi:hypothetical protein
MVAGLACIALKKKKKKKKKKKGTTSAAELGCDDRCQGGGWGRTKEEGDSFQIVAKPRNAARANQLWTCRE